MHDALGDVLAQRRALDNGAGGGIALSIVLHAAIMGAAVYAALHQVQEQSVPVIDIKFAKMPAPKAAPVAPAPVAAPQPVPVPVAPQPQPAQIPKPAAKTVPLSPFGKSTKKGAEQPSNPAAKQPTVEIPVGGTGAVVEGDFPYTIYVDRMKTLIGSHWFRPQVVAGVTTTVSFIIDRDGAVHEVTPEAPSGNTVFDLAAQRAVLESSPLPPLPFGYSGTYLRVHLTFK